MRWFADSDIITNAGLNSCGEPPHENEVKLCEIWIKTYLIKGTKNRSLGTSYKLKHDVENWTRALRNLGITLKDEESHPIDNGCYISNGAFVQAMRNLNFEYSLPQKGSITPYFGAKYNGPYIYENSGKYIPRNSNQWETVLSPLLSSINTSMLCETFAPKGLVGDTF